MESILDDQRLDSVDAWRREAFIMWQQQQIKAAVADSLGDTS